MILGLTGFWLVGLLLIWIWVEIVSSPDIDRRLMPDLGALVRNTD